MNKNKNIILLLIFIMILIIGFMGINFKEKQILTANLSTKEKLVSLQQDKIGHKECMSTGEMALYELVKNEKSQDIANIFVQDKNTLSKKYLFKIGILSANNYYSVDVHKCGVYVAKSFNYNYITGKSMAGYRAEIWKYNYHGVGEKLVLLASDLSGDLKEYKSYFSPDFRVSPSEQYLSLVRGYGGRDDYALIIKDLKTIKDVFVLPVGDITKKNPNIGGEIDFQNGGWTPDGIYFWFGVGIAADVYGFVRVDSKNWTYEVFSAPERTMWGDAFNMNTGMTTYGKDVAPWTGVVEMDQQLQEEALEAGQISSFYIYNLFTKQKYLVATTTDPTYYFRPEWLSDTKLQYELPNGEKKVYMVK